MTHSNRTRIERLLFEDKDGLFLLHSLEENQAQRSIRIAIASIAEPGRHRYFTFPEASIFQEEITDPKNRNTTEIIRIKERAMDQPERYQFYFDCIEYRCRFNAAWPEADSGSA